mgnify:CR=1 FL=1
MDTFGIKDILDIAIAALLLFYIYRIMKESGTLNIFFGVLAFIVVWVIASQLMEMKLIGTILDKFMSIGLLIIVVLFQDQIKRFLVELGDHKRWSFLGKLFHHTRQSDTESARKAVMPIVYACMSLSKTKTGALIVIEQQISLENYEKSGDMIDALINARLIENIFFKNSPLHDGAMIIRDGRICASGCFLPLSQNYTISKEMGTRHRAALGVSENSDAVVVVVSEETGTISIAEGGVIERNFTIPQLEKRLRHEILHKNEEGQRKQSSVKALLRKVKK